MLTELLDTNHYFFNPYALPPFAAAAGLCIVLLQFLVHGVPRSIRLPLSLVFVAAAIWLLSFHLMYSSKSEQDALAWAKLAYLGVPFICAATYHLAIRLRDLYDTQRPAVWAAWLVSLLFAGLAFNTELIPRVTRQWWGFYPLYGHAGIAFIGYFGAMAAASLWHFYRAYKTAESYGRKRMVQFVGLGIVTGYLAGVDFIPKLGAALYPFGYFWVLISALLVSHGLAETVEARPASLWEAATAAEIGYRARLHRQQRALLASLDVLMTDRSAAESIRRILEEAGEGVSIVRMAVWQYHAAAGTLQCRHLYRRTPQLHRVIAGQFVRPDPAYLEPLMAGRVVQVDHLVSDERMAPVQPVFLDDPAVALSGLEVPIHREGRFLGVLSAHSVGESRQWPDDERGFLKLIAEILAVIIDVRVGAGGGLPDRLIGASPTVQRVMEELIRRDRLMAEVETGTAPR
ncbi:GAF domain-containing protein [Candidatus Nitrospira bockiana]